MGCSEKLLNKELYFSAVRRAAETRGACAALAGSPSPSAAPQERSVLRAGLCLARRRADSAPPAAAFWKVPSCIRLFCRGLTPQQLLLPYLTALLRDLVWWPREAASDRTGMCIIYTAGSRKHAGQMVSKPVATRQPLDEVCVWCRVSCHTMLGGWGWGHIMKKCFACLKHSSAHLKENIGHWCHTRMPEV